MCFADVVSPIACIVIPLVVSRMRKQILVCMWPSKLGNSELGINECMNCVCRYVYVYVTLYKFIINSLIHTTRSGRRIIISNE
jgi:hypothetical protein